MRERGNKEAGRRKANHTTREEVWAGISPQRTPHIWAVIPAFVQASCSLHEKGKGQKGKGPAKGSPAREGSGGGTGDRIS